jgi:hypothetical protein
MHEQLVGNVSPLPRLGTQFARNILMPRGHAFDADVACDAAVCIKQTICNPVSPTAPKAWHPRQNHFESA